MVGILRLRDLEEWGRSALRSCGNRKSAEGSLLLVVCVLLCCLVYGAWCVVMCL